jgi:hypothetical protein
MTKLLRLKQAELAELQQCFDDLEKSRKTVIKNKDKLKLLESAQGKKVEGVILRMLKVLLGKDKVAIAELHKERSPTRRKQLQTLLNEIEEILPEEKRALINLR